MSKNKHKNIQNNPQSTEGQSGVGVSSPMCTYRNTIAIGQGAVANKDNMLAMTIIGNDQISTIMTEAEYGIIHRVFRRMKKESVTNE